MAHITASLCVLDAGDMLIRFWFGQLHIGRPSGIASYPYQASVTLCWGSRGDVPPEAPSWRHVWHIAWDWLPIRKYRSLRPTIKIPPTEGELLNAAITGHEAKWHEIEDQRGIDSVSWTGRDKKFIGFDGWPRDYLHHRATRRSLMHVYLNGAKERRNPSHMMYVQPANMVRAAERPEEWVNPDGTAKDFHIEFKYGRAEVPENLGRLLIATGHAKATNLVRATGGSLLGSLASTIRGH